MNVFYQLNNLPAFNRSVITIGTFDGVHKGHVQLIEKIKNIADQTAGESVIITFHPHPRLVINPSDQSLRLLNTIDEKIELLRQHGINNVVVVPFSRDFSEMSAEEYVSSFLVKSFHPATIVIGYDHRFGKNRTGNFSLLEKMKSVYGYELVEIQQEMLDDISISSTKIRTALNEGHVQLANQLLGYKYAFTGTVVRGLQNGRKLGYPTANLQLSDERKLIPRTGIYAVRVLYKPKSENLPAQVYAGMMSIGYNPTFDGKTQTIEVNILDFDGDLYGEQLTVELVDFIRNEKKFDSIDELIAAIADDEVKTRGIIRSAI